MPGVLAGPGAGLSCGDRCGEQGPTSSDSSRGAAVSSGTDLGKAAPGAEAGAPGGGLCTPSESLSSPSSQAIGWSGSSFGKDGSVGYFATSAAPLMRPRTEAGPGRPAGSKATPWLKAEPMQILASASAMRFCRAVTPRWSWAFCSSRSWFFAWHARSSSSSSLVLLACCSSSCCILAAAQRHISAVFSSNTLLALLTAASRASWSH
mmetsp:Transcript_120350/g.335773  ORF Transcript_120350/g.335773 Transcript_120350/m.335773 type:complete len:207 (+) Transcript_120350:716-1336(+)